MKTTEIGRIGEDAVCRYLTAHGYQILTRNYRQSGGEIDIIAKDGEYLAFVEVKTRRLNSMVSPLECLTKQQQHRIIRTAIAYCAKYNADWQFQPRYDLAAVELWNGTVFSLEYIENAFDTTGLDVI